jgi:hypothetical protein
MPANTITPHEPDDDGFNRSSNDNRPARPNYLAWSPEYDWRTNDGTPSDDPLAAIRTSTCLRRWKDGHPMEIVDHPLPDPDELNAAIPMSEWELGVDGKTPRPPWEYTFKVSLVNLNTGEFFVFASATVGAGIAYDKLRDAVIAMRALRGGEPVVPVVRLSSKPMKTRYGMKSRPSFDIIDWKTPGGPAALPTAPLQLPNGAASSAATPEPSNSNGETAPPRGGRGRMTIESGRSNRSNHVASASVYDELEARRPDLKPVLDDDLPF